MCLGSSNAGDVAREQQQQQQSAIESGMKQINSAYSGFNDDFYNKVKKDYTSFASPQLYQQYGQNVKNLDYNLANRGLTRSSAGSDLSGLLSQGLAQGQQGVADAAQGQSDTIKNQVAQSKNTLVGQLQASADPASIAQQALTTAAGFKAPSTFAPVGNFFSNWASLYGANSQANQYNALLNSQLFNKTVGGGTGNNFAPIT